MLGGGGTGCRAGRGNMARPVSQSPSQDKGSASYGGRWTGFKVGKAAASECARVRGGVTEYALSNGVTPSLGDVPGAEISGVRKV